MVLEAFACLVAVPVHEEAVGGVSHEHCNCHGNSDTEGGDAAEGSGEEGDGSDGFGDDGEGGEECGDAHVFGEEAHGAAKAVAAEPAEELLGSVREDDDGQGQAGDEGSDIVVGREDGFDDRIHNLVIVDDCQVGFAE